MTSINNQIKGVVMNNRKNTIYTTILYCGLISIFTGCQHGPVDHLATSLQKLVIEPTEEPIEDIVIKGTDIFTHFTGMTEAAFKKATNATVEYGATTGKDKYYKNMLKPGQSGPFSQNSAGDFILTNNVTGATYNAGQYVVYPPEYLTQNTENYKANKPGSFHVVIGSGVDKQTDIVNLQLQAALSGEKAAFLVASNYNGIEVVSGNSDPSIDIYLHDPTQGPAASFGCFPGALLRLYSQIREAKQVPTSFFDPKNPQVHMLKADFLDTQNGYVHLNRDIVFDGGIEPFLEKNHYSFSIMYHKNQAVSVKHAIVGNYFESFTIPGKIPEHTVDQILSAGLSLGGYRESFLNGYNAPEAFLEALAEKILFDVYSASIRAAIKNQRDTVYLLPIGCGVFGNKKIWAGRALERCKFLIRDSGLTVKYIIPGLEKKFFETDQEFNGFIDVIKKLTQETGGSYIVV